MIHNLFKANFGLEKENLRVDSDGNISNKPHTSTFLESNPYVVRDFAESQIEMITQVHPTIDATVDQLYNIQHSIISLLEDELLWPQSNPPILNDESLIKIANYSDVNKVAYRNYLSEKYGNKRSVISGIHFNMSFADDLIEELFNQSDKKDFAEFKNNLYLKVLKKFLNYKYIFTNIFAASPIFHESFIDSCVIGSKRNDQNDCFHENLISLRNSSCGYTNLEPLYLDYTSLINYDNSVQKLIDDNSIVSESEIYEPVRLKRNRSNNIEYLEFRFIDINPLYFVGVNSDDLKLLHLFMIYFAQADDFDYNLETQSLANQYDHELNTMFIEKDNSNKLKREAISLLEEMSDYFKSIPNNIYLTTEIINQAVMKFKDESLTYKSKLIKGMSEKNYIDYHLNIAKEYTQQVANSPLYFKGNNDLELSTKIILKDSIKLGLLYEVVDSTENFIKLTNPQNMQVEYIKEATKTSLDNYSSVLVMENKHITKSVLADHNVNVPSGVSVSSLESGFSLIKQNFSQYKLVVKPNNTNFGLGISILDANVDDESYRQALALAFKYDSTVLIEKFIQGLEYRFLVVDQKVVAILHRTSANVVGDGKSTISELIAKKNLDPRRDKGYKTPLEIIEVDQIVIEYLKANNKELNYIPKDNEQVFLRANSNISTGGDSLDYTDLMHPSYVEIAKRAAEALNVSISGVDMIIEDYSLEAMNDNYSILEMNFNPAIHIHNYPYLGLNRNVGEKIIAALFSNK